MSQNADNLIDLSQGSLVMELLQDQAGLAECQLFAPKSSAAIRSDYPLPLFQIATIDSDIGVLSPMNTCYSSLARSMRLTNRNRDENGFTLRFRSKSHPLEVNATFLRVDDLPLFRVFSSVKNLGDRPTILTHLSSCLIGGLAAKHQFETDIHYCHQTWQAEGQWKRESARKAGLQEASVHPDTGCFRLRSVGSFSTSRYWPIVVVTSAKLNAAWFAQIETSSAWYLEVGSASGWKGEEGALYIHAGGASERELGWYRELNPGECYEAPPVAIGTVEGGWEDAVQMLTKYRRLRLRQNGVAQKHYVFFNDYMNCLWGDPTEERLAPLIETAYQCGCEGFCIDAGWFGSRSEPFGQHFGEWHPSTDRFGEKGLQGIIETIRDRGMIPGLWTEIEVCDPSSPLGNKPDHWFLQRYRTRILSNNRLFLDYRQQDVCDYMHGVFDRLVAMGIAFIKNDYNECVGWGVDSPSGSPINGLLDHTMAFYQFLQELRRRHPGLMLESCSSGAMRSDWGLLQFSDLQSTSDQEQYQLNPSIVEGSLALFPPEQAGIWAYPYPHCFLKREDKGALETAQYEEAMKDGEQTIFNMVTGLCGTLYLSGRLDRADGENLELIREGVALWKTLRDFYRNALPIWPLGTHRISELDSWNCLGLWNPSSQQLYLAVWRQNSNHDVIDIPISQLRGKKVHWDQVYPANSRLSTGEWNYGSGVFRLRLEKQRTARLFRFSHLSPFNRSAI